MDPENDNGTNNASNRVAQLEQALAEKERELGMVREENNLRRLRDMRMANTMQVSSHGQAVAPPPDPLDKELEELDPKARSIVERLVGREVRRTVAPIVEEIGGIKNITLAQANYQQIVRHFPKIEEVAGEVAAEIDRLPDGEREAILRSPYSISLIGRKIHAEKFGNGSGKPPMSATEIRGSVRSRAVGESATTGPTHEIGAGNDEPAIRKQIASTHPLSPEWEKVKAKMREEKKARGIR